jgi:hypothetical protein
MEAVTGGRYMKKLLIALAVACLSTTGFALGKDLEMSAGIGFSVSPYSRTEQASSEAEKSKSTEETMLFGGFAYFDATYAQVSLGFGRSDVNASYKVVDDLGIMGGAVDATYNNYNVVAYLSFGLLCKYPFDMDGFYIFPMLGFEYDLNLSYTDSEGNDLKESMTDDERANLNMFWIKLGVGLDIPIAGEIYLRPEVLASYKLRSKLDRDWVDQEEASGYDDVSATTVKVDIGFLVGYKFK